MHINITLGGALIQYRPEGCTGNRFSYESTSPLTVDALLGNLNVPDNQRLLTILNGNVISQDNYPHTSLSEGDELSLMPPITAG